MTIQLCNFCWADIFCNSLKGTILFVFHKDLRVEWWQSEAYLYPHSAQSCYCSSLYILPMETTNQETTRWVKIGHLWQTHFKVHWVLRRIQSRKQWILWATFKSKQRRSVIYSRFKLTICAKMKFSWKNEKKILFNLLFLFRPFLNKCHVVRHHVLAQQVFRASQESLDPRDQQVLQDHMGIVDPKDP